MRKVIALFSIVLLIGYVADAQTCGSHSTSTSKKETKKESKNMPSCCQGTNSQCMHDQNSSSSGSTSTAGTTTTTESTTVTTTNTGESSSVQSESKGCNGSGNKSCCQHPSKTEMLKTSTKEAPDADKKVLNDTTTPQE